MPGNATGLPRVTTGLTVCSRVGWRFNAHRHFTVQIQCATSSLIHTNDKSYQTLVNLKPQVADGVIRWKLHRHFRNDAISLDKNPATQLRFCRSLSRVFRVHSQVGKRVLKDGQHA
ncbi:hypothetical protein L6164_009049 [Bauhinia variegata]|uniref:Uncharacterized protein n=1 Tax=Bauhinia variegata TaxID=167791 RepID=A0ACB9PHI0_BAUVA|nr:hypothetical protein L6164_009049 [Bauhinia variegata]